LKYYFVIANEKLNSGLLQSQLIKPLEVYFKDQAILINLCRPFTTKYKSNNITIINIPILIPFRFINYNILCIFNDILCILYAFFIFIRIFNIKRQKRIFVNRGYVPGLVGYWMKILFNNEFVFDPRSLYIYEHIGANNIIKDSICYKYWKWLEKRVSRKSKNIVCVSKAMSDYFSNINYKCYDKNIRIPCIAEPVNSVLDLNNYLEIRNKYNYKESDIVVAYYGSLNYGWNNLLLYMNYFKKLNTLGYKILILSQDASTLRNTELSYIENLSIYGGDTREAQSQALELLQVADYGIILMKNSPDWETRLSVKFTQYTSFGIPVIVNKYVGEASRLIKKYDLNPSLIIDKSDSDIKLYKAPIEQKKHIRLWAKEYFNQKNILKLKLNSK